MTKLTAAFLVVNTPNIDAQNIMFETVLNKVRIV